MTAQERFEGALNLWANALLTFSDNREAAIADLRSTHAACVEEARREGAEREREECARILEPWPQTYGNAPAAIRARSKGGDAS